MSKCTTDPRYRQGVYVGFDPNDAERKAREQREALAECHPMTYGWKPDYWNVEYDLQVYRLNGHKLMCHPVEDGWLVRDNLNQWHVEGSEALARTTKEVLDGMLTQDIPFMGEPAGYADEYGLEAVV